MRAPLQEWGKPDVEIIRARAEDSYLASINRRLLAQRERHVRHVRQVAMAPVGLAGLVVAGWQVTLTLPSPALVLLAVACMVVWVATFVR